MEDRGKVGWRVGNFIHYVYNAFNVNLSRQNTVVIVFTDRFVDFKSYSTL